MPYSKRQYIVIQERGRMKMDMARDLFYAQQAIVALFSVTNKLQMQGDKHLKDLTIRQMLAIPALVHAPDGKANVNNIAKTMGTSKQNAKQIVNALMKKGYLSVEPSVKDKRALQITITAKGKKAFEVCSQRTDEFLANTFSAFSSRDLEVFSNLLDKLYNSDSTEKESIAVNAVFNARNSKEILLHHKSFAKLRSKAQLKEV